MHELMLQAGVKGMSERSELIPCIIYHCEGEIRNANGIIIRVYDAGCGNLCWGRTFQGAPPLYEIWLDIDQ